jgi:hypothetical protein
LNFWYLNINFYYTDRLNFGIDHQAGIPTLHRQGEEMNRLADTYKFTPKRLEHFIRTFE